MDFILRPWKVSDAKALARHLNNKKILHLLGKVS